MNASNVEEKDILNSLIQADLGIEYFKQTWLEKWWNTPCAEQSDCLRERCRKEQRHQQKAADVLLKELRQEAADMPQEKVSQRKWSRQMGEKVKAFALTQGYFTREQLNLFIDKGFYETTRLFIQEVKVFDPALSWEDTFQAMRNVWIINTIQVLLGQKACFTPSVFAYSMLYPYTDNYLDNPAISQDAKAEISVRFRGRLAGGRLTPRNHHEDCLNRLVAMIEEQYPRKLFPKVYAALLGIHDAQMKSLLQQYGIQPAYERDILGISIEKGGISVLADAYLVKGDLSDAEANFMFGFGVVLQLADDLQDIEEDQGRGHSTVFSQTAGKWLLGPLTARLLRMTAELREAGKCFGDEQSAVVFSLVEQNCNLLILKAVSENRAFYSREDYHRLERYAPFPFTYLSTLDKRLNIEYGRIKRSLKSKCTVEEILEDAFMT